MQLFGTQSRAKHICTQQQELHREQLFIPQEAFVQEEKEATLHISFHPSARRPSFLASFGVAGQRFLTPLEWSHCQDSRRADY